MSAHLSFSLRIFQAIAHRSLWGWALGIKKHILSCTSTVLMIDENVWEYLIPGDSKAKLEVLSSEPRLECGTIRPLLSTFNGLFKNIF